MSAYILRTWGCQNTACQTVFEAGEANPPCPHCGCIRVGWVPAKVSIGKTAPFADRTLRDLADAYGLSDLNSPSPSRQPQAKVLARPGRSSGSAGVVNFQGFAANIDPAGARTPTNQSGAQCLPTVNTISAKVKAGMEQKLSGQLGFANPSTNARIERARP